MSETGKKPSDRDSLENLHAKMIEEHAFGSEIPSPTPPQSDEIVRKGIERTGVTVVVTATICFVLWILWVF